MVWCFFKYRDKYTFAFILFSIIKGLREFISEVKTYDLDDRALIPGRGGKMFLLNTTALESTQFSV
jgi:hypothetical protein